MNAEEYAELTIVEKAEKQPTEALVVLDKSKAIQVFDQPTLTLANDFLRGVKELRRKFDDEFNPGISQAFAHHRYLTAQKKRWTDPLDEAERAIKPKIAEYLIEQDRVRFEAERAVQRAKEAAAKEAQDAADEALALIEQGKTAQADKVVEAVAARIEDIQADTPFVPDKPVANGTTLRETWDYEITDAALIPRTFLVPDLTMIRRYGQNMKHQADVPGVRFFSVKSVASRSGR